MPQMYCMQPFVCYRGVSETLFNAYNGFHYIMRLAAIRGPHLPELFSKVDSCVREVLQDILHSPYRARRIAMQQAEIDEYIFC